MNFLRRLRMNEDVGEDVMMQAGIQTPTDMLRTLHRFHAAELEGHLSRLPDLEKKHGPLLRDAWLQAKKPASNLYLTIMIACGAAVVALAWRWCNLPHLFSEELRGVIICAIVFGSLYGWMSEARHCRHYRSQIVGLEERLSMLWDG